MNTKVMKLSHSIYQRLLNKVWELTTMKYYKVSFKSCGKDLRIAKGVIIEGLSNIEMGDNVYIGPGSIIYSTEASLTIGDNFLAGPRLTIITGDHKFDVVGKTIAETKKRQLIG